ncbi:MAG: SDR family NAD(P)-dependent oxidoreductase [Sphingopyxis sp.]
MVEGQGVEARGGDALAPRGRLAGRVALVTGAGHGIGRGCALAFAAAGACVIGVDRDGAAMDAIAHHAATAGTPLSIAAPVDLLDEGAVAALVANIGAVHGRIDIVVNAAAHAVFGWIEDLSLAQWRATLAGELDIVFLLTRAAWPWLKRSGRASIINFSSANARHALDGSPALAHCAGKGGVMAMTRQLAMEGAAHGIRANSIAPGFIETAATAAHLAADPPFAARVLAKNMIQRFGTPADIAHCALWLASDEAGYVTGADIAVDGGATAW